MKTIISKSTLWAALFGFAWAFAVPALRADDSSTVNSTSALDPSGNAAAATAPAKSDGANTAVAGKKKGHKKKGHAKKKASPKAPDQTPAATSDSAAGSADSMAPADGAGK